jgi:predicted negative regulator of RcsB-dependent stress response
VAASDEIRAQIQRHLITGDNRLKQGTSPAKARESYERALELAQQAGLEDAVRPLVEIRLADLKRLEGESSPASAPGD